MQMVIPCGQPNCGGGPRRRRRSLFGDRGYPNPFMMGSSTFSNLTVGWDLLADSKVFASGTLPVQDHQEAELLQVVQVHAMDVPSSAYLAARIYVANAEPGDPPMGLLFEVVQIGKGQSSRLRRRALAVGVY